jgi:hypothetical protein
VSFPPPATPAPTDVAATPTDPLTTDALGSPGDVAATTPTATPTALGETAIAQEQQDRILEESALVTPADPWKLLPVNLATTKLNWVQVYAQLEPLPSGTVALLPTIRSGWVKVVVGARPEASTFYVRLDPELMYAEPGSLALDYGGPAPPPPDDLARVHLGLDVMGLTPVLGGPADLANTILYAVEGDAQNSALSAVGLIPGLGEAAVAARHGDDIIRFGSRRVLRSVLHAPDGFEAHHVIPWELRYHPLVQAAARAGFDMNSAENGILLTKLVTEPWPSGYNVTKATLTVEQELDVTQAIQIVEGVHANHPAYNFYVLKRLQDLLAEVTTPEGIIDPDAARAVLENELIPELVPQLGGAAALNIVVNDHFKKVITDNGWRDLYGFYNRDPKMYRFIHGDYTDPY